MDAVDLIPPVTPATMESQGARSQGKSGQGESGEFGILLATMQSNAAATGGQPGGQGAGVQSTWQASGAAPRPGGLTINAGFHLSGDLQAAIQAALANSKPGVPTAASYALTGGSKQPGSTGSADPQPGGTIAAAEHLLVQLQGNPAAIVAGQKLSPVAPTEMSAANDDQSGAASLDQQVQELLATLAANGVVLTPVQGLKAGASDTGANMAAAQRSLPPTPGTAGSAGANPFESPALKGDQQAASQPVAGQAEPLAKQADFAMLMNAGGAPDALTPQARRAIEQLTRAMRRDGDTASTTSTPGSTTLSHAAASGPQTVQAAAQAMLSPNGDGADVALSPAAAEPAAGGKTTGQPQNFAAIVAQADGSALTGNPSAPADAAPRHAYAPPAEQVAVQIGRALQAGSNKFQIQLDPAELGRVSVRLDMHDDGSVSMMVSAAHPDTLDLLQRDQRGLEKVMQDAGFKTPEGSLNFSLQSGDGGQRQAFWNDNNGGNNNRASGNDFTDAPDAPDQLGVLPIRLSSHAGALDIQA